MYMYIYSYETFPEICFESVETGVMVYSKALLCFKLKLIIGYIYIYMYTYIIVIVQYISTRILNIYVLYPIPGTAYIYPPTHT